MKSSTAMHDDRISLTAHYTGYVWKKNGMSELDLATRKGWALYQIGRPLNAVAALAWGGRNLESFLLDRHRQIDQLLSKEIESGRVSQVIELAAGLSSRGSNFMRRYEKSHGLVYIESDLPAQIETKEQLLRTAVARMSGAKISSRHHFLAIDALADDGFRDALALLDPERGCAIITEGLLSYFPTPRVLKLFERIAKALSTFSYGIYLSDLHLENEQPLGALGLTFKKAIEACVRGQLHLHFKTAVDADAAMRRAGFQDFKLDRSGDRDFIRILSARVGRRLVHSP